MGREEKKRVLKHGQQDTHTHEWRENWNATHSTEWNDMKKIFGIDEKQKKKANEASTFTNELLTEMSTCLYFSLSCPFTLRTAKPSLNCHTGVMIVPVLINHSHRSEKKQRKKNGTEQNKTHSSVLVYVFMSSPDYSDHVLYAIRAFSKAASLSLTFYCSKTINHKQFAFFILSFFHCDYFVVVGDSGFFFVELVSYEIFGSKPNTLNELMENVNNLLQKSSEHRGK